MTIATRLKGGAIFEVGPSKNLPISDLFFAGGATTVRGYPEQLLGPTTFDSEGYKNKAIGGKLLYLMNVEIRIPIYWLFVGEIFLDGGNVWREISDFDPTEIKFSTGLGLVLLTPVGPIRFDYGVKLNKEDSDKTRGVFHFGLYFAF
jgi:outer membrane protein assembly factor BamA